MEPQTPTPESQLKKMADSLRSIRDFGEIDLYAEAVIKNKIQDGKAPDYSPITREFEYLRANFEFIIDSLRHTVHPTSELTEISERLYRLYKHPNVESIGEQVLQNDIVIIDKLISNPTAQSTDQIRKIQRHLTELQIIYQTFQDSVDYLENQNEVTVTDITLDDGLPDFSKEAMELDSEFYQ